MDSVAIELTARYNQKCTYCYNAWRSDGGGAMGELSNQQLLASPWDSYISAGAPVTLWGYEHAATVPWI
jgi:MoaA/NifB/PqqE/SkfB family radical SAM enzyme